jgi:hypothetical protein
MYLLKKKGKVGKQSYAVSEGGKIDRCRIWNRKT